MDSEVGSKYEALLSSIGDGIIATDKEGKIIFINLSAEASLGWKSEELLGKHLQEALGLYDRNGIAVSLRERPFEIALTTGETTTTSASASITSTADVYFYQRKDGTRFPVAMTVTAIVLDKATTGAIEVFRDITKEIELDNLRTGEQERAKETELKDEATLASIDSGIISVDEQGRIVAMSRAAEKMLGWRLEEVKNGDVQEIVQIFDEQGNLIPKEKRPMHVALKTGEDTTTSSIGTATYFYTRRDGTKFPVSIAVAPIIFEGKIFGAIDNFRDITEEIERTTQLAEAKAKDEALLSSIGDGVMAVDTEGKVIFMNHAAETLLGWKSEELLGKNLHEFSNVYDDQGIQVPYEKRPIDIAISSGKTTFADTYFYDRKDGTKFPVSLLGAPVVLSNNKIIGAIDVFRDITKEKELDKEKSEFISLASHQLRSPNTAISWNLEALLDGDKGPLNDGQKELANEAHKSSKIMEELIGGFLDATKVESNGFAIERGDVDLAQISDSVLGELAKQIQDKKLNITKQYGTDVPHLDIGTKTARIILQNLLTNAVKYTPESGAVEVKIEKTPEGVTISVKDNGYGIPEAAKNRIFTKLFRAENAIEKEPSGTGLGLYLLKSLVDKLGGKVWFESKEGAGSTFYVNLK